MSPLVGMPLVIRLQFFGRNGDVNRGNIEIGCLEQHILTNLRFSKLTGLERLCNLRPTLYVSEHCSHLGVLRRETGLRRVLKQKLSADQRIESNLPPGPDFESNWACTRKKILSA